MFFSWFDGGVDIETLLRFKSSEDIRGGVKAEKFFVLGNDELKGAEVEAMVVRGLMRSGHNVVI